MPMESGMSHTRYAHKRTPPYEPKWEEDFGFAAERYPIVATEFGISFDKSRKSDSEAYGKAIVSYCERKGISWICWIFDPKWGPNLIESWDPLKLTESGEFFKQALHTPVLKKPVAR